MPISAVVTSMKDEAPYIIEWVAYHRALGFDRIVVLANDCSDGTHEMLVRLQEMDAITYYENKVELGAKPHSSALKIANISPEVKTADFVMVLDADEFLVVKKPPHKLHVLLNMMNKKSAGMMVIPWRLFGSSQNMNFKDVPVIERFTQSMNTSELPKVGVKTLFRNSDDVRLAIHFPKFVKKADRTTEPEDAKWIDAGGKSIDQARLTWNGGRQKIHRDHAEVAHFMIKSLDEYLLKIFRGDGLMNSNRHGIDYWRNGDINEVSDLVVADNVSGFSEERDRLFADPVLSELHRKAVAGRLERLGKILANPDVQKLRNILQKSTNGDLQPEDIATSRELVTQMSPALKKENLIDGDVPHSTLLSITDANLADASNFSFRVFKRARNHGATFWPEKKFGPKPITHIVESLKRAQSREDDFGLTVRWFHDYNRAERKQDWPIDEEITIVLTRDDDSLVSGYSAHVAASKAKHFDKPQKGGKTAIREVLKGKETASEIETLISAKKIPDPRLRLQEFLNQNPSALVLNLDRPAEANRVLAELELRQPAGKSAVKLLRDMLGKALDPAEHPATADSVKKKPKKEKSGQTEKPDIASVVADLPPALRAPGDPTQVGVLTLPMNRNYGGNLQAYALMRKLRELGYRPVLLNRRHGAKEGTSEDDKNDVPVFSETIGLGQNVPNRLFVEKYLTPISRQFDSSHALAETVDRFDFGSVIVGSDQVWRPKYARSILSDFFLGFLDRSQIDTKKISYAASFGTEDDEYKPSEKALASKLLKDFDAVSVREDSAVDMCRDMFDVAAQHVLDPTLLLKSQDYAELFNENQSSGKKDYMLTYVLDATPDKVDVISRISKKMGLKPRTTSGQAFSAGDPLRGKDGDKTVEAWLASFHNAEFVVTDSFHGVAFSIIFNRPFIAYGNPARGLGRFKSLLRAVGLENRLIVDSEGADIDALMQPIDWVSVNDRLDRLRKKSMQFLKNALPKIDKDNPSSGGGSGKKSPKTDLPQPVSAAAVDTFAQSSSDQHPLNVHCTGCGGCISEAKGALEMAWSPEGFLEPRAKTDTSLQNIIKICPFNPAPDEAVKDEDRIALACLPDADKYDARLGRFLQTYVGYSPSYRPSSSSGGMATYVFKTLLGKGKVDHLFVVGRTPEGGYAYRMFGRGDDILATSKTRYYPVTLESLYSEIESVDGRVAVSGVACFVKSIRLKQHYHPELKQKIPFVAGIICGGLKSRYYTDFLAQSAGAKGGYRDAEYRIKSPDSLSSDYSFGVTDDAGQDHRIRMQKLGDMWGTGLFKSRACDFCTDVMTELADISLGDAWLPEYKKDGMGNSVVVTRSRLADDIIREGIETGELRLDPVSPDIAARTQSGGFNHKQNAVKFRMLTEEVSGQRRIPHVRSRILADSSIAEMIVQVLRNRTRRKSLEIWRDTRDHRAFMRQMRSSLRSLSGATAARKQSASVDADAFKLLKNPNSNPGHDAEIQATRAALTLFNRLVKNGTISVELVERALAKYPEADHGLDARND